MDAVEILVYVIVNAVTHPNVPVWAQVLMSILGGGTILGVYQAYKAYQAKKLETDANGSKELRDEITQLREKLGESDKIIATLRDEILTLSIQRQEYETALRLLTDYIKEDE